MADIEQVIQLGTVLARTALIEAAYGGEHGPALTSVAREFNQTIVQINDAMRGLNRARHSSTSRSGAALP